MYIYKITNLINGKIYIGQTVRSISKRWTEHCKPSSIKKSNITKAILKYGKENFNIEEVYRADNIWELNKKEIYYIKKYDSRDKTKGYNIAYGGNSTRKKQKQIVCTCTGEIFDSMSQASKFYNINVGSISNVCLGKSKTCRGMVFSFLKDWDGMLISKIKPKNKPKKIMCINDGKTFDSIAQASKFYNISQSKISLVCNGKRATCNNLSFIFINHKIKNNIKAKKRSVKCMNDHKIFNSITEASRYYNISKTGIRKSCLNHREIKGKLFIYA